MLPIPIMTICIIGMIETNHKLSPQILQDFRRIFIWMFRPDPEETFSKYGSESGSGRIRNHGFQSNICCSHTARYASR